MEKSQGSILMNHYNIQINNTVINVQKSIWSIPGTEINMSSNWISKPISPMNTNLWSQENQSSMKFQEKSPVEKEQTNKFK